MFTILLLITSLLMEGIGTYISVVGLSSLFAGDIVIIFMAIIFDLAKLTSVTFLYQNWKDVGRPMKYYMTSAVLVLMLITSGGAFGYLSAAFQRSVQPNLEIALKVDTFTAQQSDLVAEKKQLTDLKMSINSQIAAVTASDKARRLIASLRPELNQTNKRLNEVNAQIADLRAKSLAAKTDNLEKDVHTGPIIYVSKAFGLSIEDVSKYIILVIVSVFDTLAVVLLLAANFLILKKKNQLIEEPKEDLPIQEPIHEVFVEPPVEPEIVTPVIEPILPEPVVVPEPIHEPIHETVVEPPAIEKIVEEPVVVEVEPEETYSGSPESGFISEPLPVVLEHQGMVLK